MYDEDASTVPTGTPNDVVGPGFVPFGAGMDESKRTVTIRLPNHPNAPDADSLTLNLRMTATGMDADVEVSVDGQPTTPEEYDTLISLITHLT